MLFVCVIEDVRGDSTVAVSATEIGLLKINKFVRTVAGS
jgi:hypothetical protein